MKKKDLKEIEDIIKNDEEIDSSEYLKKINIFSKDVFKTNFIHGIIYFFLIILSILFINNTSKLSFIDTNHYVITIFVFMAIAMLIAIISFTLYIYNKKTGKFCTKKSLKNTLWYYQLYDALSYICIVASILLWIPLFILTPVEVNGDSMNPTFDSGDKVAVWHANYTPKVNDIVIVDAQSGNYNYSTDATFVIKRIIARGGDVVTYDEENKIVLVNGVETLYNISYGQYETMMLIHSDPNYKLSTTVPDGFYIIIGDNRNNSQDSKNVGLIYEEDILGKCVFQIYPFSDMKVIK